MAAKSGRLREMDSVIFQLSAERKERWMKSSLYNLFSSEVSLADGSPQKAIDAFEKIVLWGPPGLGLIHNYANSLHSYNFPFLNDVLGRAYAKMGDLDKAIAKYELMMTFDSKKPSFFLIHPKYHYRLAKLYEQKGLKAKATEQYQKFLDLWKDADPGLPEVEDVRKRLAGLKVPGIP